MVIELRVVQFWSEIILVISNRTRAARSFDFEITRMISDQIALHSVQLPLFISGIRCLFQYESKCEALHIKMISACSFVFMQIKDIFIRIVSHLDSL